MKGSIVRVLVCGDRNWGDKEFIGEKLKSIPFLECVIEGEARGADTCARLVADKMNIPVLKFPADWETYGKAAGFIRNKQMLVDGKPDLVLAFHDDIVNSKGTKDMLLQSDKMNIKNILYTHGKEKDGNKTS